MKRFLLTLGFFLLIFVGLLYVAPVSAASPPQSNDTCLFCHSQEGFTVELPGGETLLLTIDKSAFEEGVHGSNQLACVDCHTDITGFPHPERTYQTLREVSMHYYVSCQKCHSEQYQLTLDSVHQRALAAGNTNAAICTDCHNPHYQHRLTDPESGAVTPTARVNIPKTCARCHSLIYGEYKESVHGSALTDGNPDVPTCIDCHGVHNVRGPQEGNFAFHNLTPQLCARCHTDASIMDKYGISTQILDTYVADFHGTTVVLFEKIAPDQPTNKPVCTDCHGVHSIKRTDDPQYGIAMKDNLLTTCRRCHPDATADFPDAWMRHYIPSPDRYPVVYYVNLFYKILIPLVIGGMAIFVLTDAIRRLMDRRKGAAHS
ncbi:MAG: cytochrome C [Anaerolineae bacterium]|nr:MAG: cytochrome C [Anaerolineae bacterium]